MAEKNKKSTAGRKKQVAKKKSPVKKAAKKSVKKNSKSSVAKKSGKGEGASRGERKYVLDSVLVINNAHTMHGQLNALIDAKKDIVIDASSVEMVDTSILQLLLSFVTKINAESLKVAWMNPSDELLSRAKMLNLTDKLGLSEP